MNYKILPHEQIVPQKPVRGRGSLQFPEFLELNVSKDGAYGDCLYYPDTPYNRKKIIQAKYNYNRQLGSFKGRRFTHWFEIRGGECVIVIQRIV